MRHYLYVNLLQVVIYIIMSKGGSYSWEHTDNSLLLLLLVCLF